MDPGICTSIVRLTAPFNTASRVDKRFVKPVSIDRWVVIVYEQQRRFGEQAARDMVASLIESCRDVGALINALAELLRS